MALTKIGLKILKDSFRTSFSGSFRGELSSSASTFVGGGVSGSSTSTGSFGRVEAAGVVFADSFKSVTGGTTIDFNDDVSLTGNLTATGNVSGSITSTGSFGRVITSTADINGGTIDGITSLTAGGDLDIGAHGFRASTLTADSQTSGRVAIYGSNGLLSEDSDLTFSGDTLSATKINATNVTGSVVSASNGAFTSIDVDGGTVDGITSLTAGGNLDIGAHDFRARKLTADNQTSGNVAIYSTAGLLSEDSDLTFSGATLSATNVTTTGTIKDFASVSGSYVSTGSVGRIQTRAADIGTITGTTLSTTGNISGSATSTGSFGRLQTQQGNASIGGNIVTLGGNLTTAGTLTTQNNNVTINAVGAARTLTLNESLTVGDGHDGTITFGAASKTLTVENTSLLNQDLTSDASPTFAGATITGTLTVQEIHTEFESASILFTSGSTQFGNSTDDVHNVTGSMKITGSFQVDNGTLTAGTVDINGGTIDGITSLTAGGDLDIGSHGFRAATITADGLTAGRVPFAGTAGLLSDDSDLTFATATLSATNLTTTGTIKNMALVSGSAISTGSFGRVEVAGKTSALDVEGALTTNGAFTSLGIDDNADATAITIASNERITMGGADGNQLTINDGGSTNSVIQFQQNGSGKAMVGWDNTNDVLKLNGTTSAFADNNHLVVSSSGNVGIGIAPSHSLDILNSTTPQLNISNTASNDTVKFSQITTAHYHNNEEPMTMIEGRSDGSNNYVRLGGGRSEGNAMQILEWYFGSNDATTGGTKLNSFSDSTALFLQPLISGSSSSTGSFGNVRIGDLGRSGKLYIPGDGTPYASSAFYTTLESEGDRGIDIRSQSIIRFYIDDANTLAATIEADGDVTITDGNLVVASGHGIDFSATGDASGMSSELLDDYEEGTWTPAILYQNASGVSLDYATDGFQVGRYTKIGNVVHARLSIQVDISGSPVNDNISISGFPFTSINVTNFEGAGIADQLMITGKANYALQMSGNSTQAGMILSSISGNQGDEIGTGDNYRFNGGVTYLAA